MHRGWGMDDGATALTESDRELAESAATGSAAAFEELYRRHVQSAWRVSPAVPGKPDHAADPTPENLFPLPRAPHEGVVSPPPHFSPATTPPAPRPPLQLHSAPTAR